MTKAAILRILLNRLLVSSGGPDRGILLVSAGTRFAAAFLLSSVLWAGYFWAVGA